ncbi:GNAT family N-acetyltransferase [Rossellomorea aquimaris]|jgi:RimJ/RimL family protein N-acetyltransferase|uniref:GNAT family N-acetyltransferase n=1 Tax=Rossellomorea aquimaris TaxID=189382 RepID=A0A1J6WL59_9BACI|nr:GNAT family protein [Rossellomorea aquimaris]OIU72560.1 GNAT family N-acetyltransferase [Rossellomorea aquimaris]
MKPLLTGKQVHLTSLSEDDAGLLVKWSRNEKLQRLLDALPYKPKSEDDVKEWIGGEDHNTRRFAIRLKDSGRLIGYAELDGILWAHRVGGLSILIGEEEYQGRGLGREAMECLLDFAFDELNLHRIQLTVFSYNSHAIRLYENLGFTKEGSFRDFLQRNGKRHDMHLYGMLENEWHSQRKEG